MSKDELVNYIKSMLGESGVDVELKDEDYNIIIKLNFKPFNEYFMENIPDFLIMKV